MQSWLSWGMVTLSGCTSAISFLYSFDVGFVATSITVLGTASCGVAVYWAKNFLPAYAEAIRQLKRCESCEENKKLQGQIEKLSEQFSGVLASHDKMEKRIEELHMFVATSGITGTQRTLCRLHEDNPDQVLPCQLIP